MIKRIRDTYTFWKFLGTKPEGKQEIRIWRDSVWFNFGTYPIDQARLLRETLRKLGFKGKFRIRGRGSRKDIDANFNKQSDLPVEYAKKVALYWESMR